MSDKMIKAPMVQVRATRLLFFIGLMNLYNAKLAYETIIIRFTISILRIKTPLRTQPVKK